MPLEDLEASEDRDDADLWFLPGPMEDEPVSRLVPDFN